VGPSVESSDTFDVVILGFEPRDEPPAARLERAFGIDAEASTRLCASLPMTVQRAVSRVRAEYFRRALVLLGARVEVRDPTGQLLLAEPSSEAQSPSVEAAPSAPPPVVAASAVSAPTALSAWIDPTSRTFANVATPLALAETTPPEAAPGATSWDVRLPAHPTLREGSQVLPERAVVSAAMPAPATNPPPQPRRVALAGWGDPLPIEPARAAAPELPVVRAPVAPSELLGPRMPSSVWDPPPPAAPVAAAAPVVPARIAEPVHAPAPARIAEPVAPPITVSEPSALDPHPLQLSKSGQHFDLTRSIAVDALWRPPAAATAEPAAAPKPASAPEPAAAITLDGDPADGARRVLSPWEQPNVESMVEPKAVPKVAPPPRRKPPPVAGNSARASADAPRAVEAKRAPAARAKDAAAASKAAAVGVALREPTQRSLANVDLRSFWETIGESLALPFTGPGVYWIGAITAWSVCVGALDMLMRFALIAGAVVTFFAHSSLLAFACDYFRVCLWTPATGDKALDRRPDFDATKLLERYVKSGAHLSIFIVASQVPLIWWAIHNTLDKVAPLDILTDPVTWLLALLPYYYWPMAVGIAALSNNFGAVWNVAAGVRAIARAPAEYSVIVLIGVATLVGSWVGLLLFGSLFGITGAVVSGTIGLPLAISHGIQGALMGHLARARPEVFE
jgi:hypothetical protein